MRTPCPNTCCYFTNSGPLRWRDKVIFVPSKAISNSCRSTVMPTTLIRVVERVRLQVFGPSTAVPSAELIFTLAIRLSTSSSPPHYSLFGANKQETYSTIRESFVPVQSKHQRIHLTCHVISGEFFCTYFMNDTKMPFISLEDDLIPQVRPGI